MSRCQNEKKTMQAKPPKPRKCKSCSVEFMPQRMGQAVCSPVCALDLVRKGKAKTEAIKAKVERKETRAKLEKLKTISQLEEDCRKIVQKIARIRDRDDGCISCHMPANYGGLWHGSHFRPAGNNAAVQFHLWNIHKACAQCNLFKAGNLSAYRPRLVEKIGADRVEWLERQNHPVKTNVAHLIRFKAVMGKRLRRIEKRLKAQP